MRPTIEYKFNGPETFYTITANDLTLTTTQNSSLITSYNKQLYTNFVWSQVICKKTTINLKFNIDQINKKIKTGKTVAILAQGDTGANISATNNVFTVHNYFEYDKPVKVGVFSEEI